MADPLEQFLQSVRYTPVPPPTPAVAPVKPGSDVIEGLTAGLGGTVQGAGALLEAATGDSIGSGLRQYGQEVIQNASTRAPGAQPEAGYADRTQFGISQSLGSSLPLSVGGAAVGGALGSLLPVPGLGTAVGAAIGGLGGTALSSLLSELGQMRQEQVDTGKGGTAASLLPYAATSAGTEAANTALDVGVGYLATKALSAVPGVGPVASAVGGALLGKGATTRRAVADALVGAQGSTRRAVTGAVGAGAATAAITEPPTEAAQEYLQVLARQTYDPAYTTDKPEVQERIKQSAIQALEMAPWMGGFFGGIGAGAHGLQARGQAIEQRNTIANQLASALGIHPDPSTPLDNNNILATFQQYALDNGVDTSRIKTTEPTQRAIDIYAAVDTKIRNDEAATEAQKLAAERARQQLDTFARTVGVDPTNKTSEQLAGELHTAIEERNKIDLTPVDPARVQATIAKVIGLDLATPNSRATIFSLAETDKDLQKKTKDRLVKAANSLGIDADKAATLPDLYDSIVKGVENNARQENLNTSLGLTPKQAEQQATRRKEAETAIRQIGAIPLKDVKAETIAGALNKIAKIDPLHPANFATKQAKIKEGDAVIFADTTAAVPYVVEKQNTDGSVALRNIAANVSFTVPAEQAKKLLAPVDLTKWRAAVDRKETSVADRTRLVTASTDPAAIDQKVREYGGATNAQTVRSNAGQVQERGPIDRQGASESGGNIQQPTPETTSNGQPQEKVAPTVQAPSRLAVPTPETESVSVPVIKNNNKTWLFPDFIGDTIVDDFASIFTATQFSSKQKLDLLLESLRETYKSQKVNSMAAIVERLQQLSSGKALFGATRIQAGATSTGAVGHYNPNTLTLTIDPRAFAPHVILHELIHAATAHAIKDKYFDNVRLKEPLNNNVARLERIMQDVQKDLSGRVKKPNYAFKDMHEFVAEAMSNAGFQKYLKTFKITEGQTAWTKFVEAVAKILGLKPSDHNALSEIMTIVDTEFFSGPTNPFLLMRTGNTLAMPAYKDTFSQVLHGARISIYDREDSPLTSGLTNSFIDNGPKGWVAGPRAVTRIDSGVIDPRTLQRIPGEMGEEKLFKTSPTGRMSEAQWDAFLNDIKQNGIKNEILVIVEKNGKVHISEGNHRLRAAIALGVPIPVEIRYFGNSDIAHGLILKPEDISNSYNTLAMPAPLELTEQDRAEAIRNAMRNASFSKTTAWDVGLSKLSDIALKIAPMDKYVRALSKYFKMYDNPMEKIDRLRQQRSTFEDNIASAATRDVHVMDALPDTEKQKVNYVADLMASTWLDPRLPKEQQKFTREMWEARGLDKQFGDYDSAYQKVHDAWKTLPNQAAHTALNNMFMRIKALTDEYLDALTSHYYDSLDPELPQQERARLAKEFKNKFALAPTTAYMPNQRHGPYFLTVGHRDENDKFIRDYYEGVPYEGTAAQRVEALRKAGYEAFYETKLAFHERVDAAGAATMREIEQQFKDALVRKSGLDPNDPELEVYKNSLAQALAGMREMMIDALPESSFFKNQQRRGFIQGQSQDRITDYLRFSMNMAHRLGDVKYGLKQYDQLARMRQHIREAKQNYSADAKYLPQMTKAYNGMAERLDKSMTSGVNAFTDFLSRASFAMYLSSPSQFLVQATQPYTYWAAKMAGEGYNPAQVYGGLTRWMQKNLTAKRLREATIDEQLYTPEIEKALEIFKPVTLDDVLEGRSTKQVGDYLNSPEDIEKQVSALPEETQQLLALRRAMDRGLVDISLVHEGRARTTETSPSAASKGLKHLENFLALPMQKSELWVRMSTLLTGFDLAREKGMSFEDALNFSEQMTRYTQGDYSTANRAPALNTGVGRVLTNLQTFRIFTIAAIMIDAYDAVSKISDPVQRAAARKSLGWLYGSTALLGGAAAVPFAGALLGLLNVAMGLASGEDEPEPDVEKAFHQMFDDAGPVGVALSRGLPAAVLGTDISKRVGLGDLSALPFGQVPDYMEGRSASDRLAALILGPTYDATFRMTYEAAKAWREGDYKTVFEKTFPKMFADISKGVSVANNGVQTSDKTTLIPEPTAWDIIATMLGIKTTDIAKAQAQNSYVMQRSADLNQIKGQMYREYARAAIEGSQEDMNDVILRMLDMSTRHPEAAVSPSAMRAAVQDAVRKQLGIRPVSYQRVAESL